MTCSTAQFCLYPGHGKALRLLGHEYGVSDLVGTTWTISEAKEQENSDDDEDDEDKAEDDNHDDKP